MKNKKLISAQDAIKQAIDGGYKWSRIKLHFIDGSFWLITSEGNLIILNEQILLDPLFWAALGKVRGWGQEIYKTDTGEEWGQRTCLHCGVGTDYQPPLDSGCNHVHYPEACKHCSDKGKKWQYHADDWFKVKMSNGSEQKFWESLP